MKTIEVVMNTTQRIREVFLAYVEDDDPLTKMTPASLDPDAVFADSRFELVETEPIAHLHIDVEAVDVADYTLQDQVEDRR
jgi:hypothetical protein